MSDKFAPSGVNKLKELLFEPETQRISALQSRLDSELEAAAARSRSQDERLNALFEKAGTEERLQSSVAKILDGAFREAEVSRHKELSHAVAPLVVNTIKYELKNSQDEMVDALYPLTGRLVKQYVQSAMNDLMVEINAKLGGGRRKALLDQSAATGLSPEELALAEANQLQVEEIFLVRRATGDLAAHWEREGSATNNRDVLTASYISAIMSFAEDAFGSTPGSFRTLTLENTERLFVRGSSAYLLAVRTRGSAPAHVEAAIDESFIDALDRFQTLPASDTPSPAEQAALAAILPGVAKKLDTRIADEKSATLAQASAAAAAARPSFARLYTLLGIILLPLIAWTLWSTYQSYLTRRTSAAIARVIETTPALRGYIAHIDVEPGGNTASITGIMPSEAVRNTLFDRVKSEIPWAVARDQTAILPSSAASTARALEDLRAMIQRLESTLAQQIGDASTTANRAAAAATAAGATATAAATAAAALPAELARLREEIARLNRPPTPREALDAFARANSIFFSNGNDFRDPSASRTTLDRLATLLKADPALGLRIVGYTDERGTPVRNSGLAQTRAETVAQELERRNVPRRQLLTLGRPNLDIARDDGPESNNRRVQFEVAFDGELGAR